MLLPDPIEHPLVVGVAQGALDYALGYMQTRKQFGQPLASFQALRFRSAELASRIAAARQLSYHAAVLAEDEGRPTGVTQGAVAFGTAPTVPTNRRRSATSSAHAASGGCSARIRSRSAHVPVRAGSIVATGTGDELLADDTIKEAYLGVVS